MGHIYETTAFCSVVFSFVKFFAYLCVMRTSKFSSLAVVKWQSKV